MPISLAHQRGTLLQLRYSAPTYNFTSLPVMLLIEDPETGFRLTPLKWLNGGSDGALENSGAVVLFEKLPPWSAANLYPGLWRVSALVGTVGTTLIPGGCADLVVSDYVAGAPPQT